MTQVESYLVPEVEELVTEPDKLDEWKGKVEELQLEGQKELYKKDKSPIPFPLMDTTSQRVYRTLCPNETYIERYNKVAIPLQVLSLVALCNQEKYFTKIYILDDYANPDPICIGKTEDYKEYIIARWGDELRSFPELLQIAKKKKVEELKRQVGDRFEDLSRVEKNPQHYVDKYFAGEWVHFSSISM